MSGYPKIVIDPAKVSIYDNAPPGALMPWKRGTEPHPGWEWAEDLAQFDAGVYAPDAEAGWYGWIRRKSEAREIAEVMSKAPRRILAVLPEELPREHGIEMIVCPTCGLDAGQTPCTQAERNDFGCGKPYDCCSVTFACANGHRTALRVAAPEADW